MNVTFCLSFVCRIFHFQAFRDLGYSVKQAEVRQIAANIPEGLTGRLTQSQFIDILVRTSFWGFLVRLESRDDADADAGAAM